MGDDASGRLHRIDTDGDAGSPAISGGTTVGDSLDRSAAARDAEPSADVIVRVLAVGLAVVLLADQIGVPQWLHQVRSGSTPGLLAAATTATAITTVVVRGRRWCAVAMLVAASCYFGVVSPDLSNHAVWIVLVLIGVDAAVIWSIVHARSSAMTAVAIVGVLAGVLLVAYTAAAFAKLNTSFLDPSTSCANEFAGWWSQQVGAAAPRDGTIATLVPWSVALTEVSIAAFALMRRTRWLAIVIGMTFHYLVAFDNGRHFFDFSAVVMLGLTALGGSVVLRPLARSLQSPVGRWWAIATGTGAGVLALTWAARRETSASFPASYLDGAAYTWRWWWWMLASTPWVVIVVRVAVRELRRGTMPPAVPGGRAAWTAMCLTLVIALGPYVGYRTAGSFGMYSSLVTDDGRTNHLFLPGVLRIGWPDDTVVVDRRASPAFRAVASRPFPAPELAWRAADQTDAFLRYRIGADVYAGRAGDLPVTGARWPFPWYHLQRFAPRVSGNELACRWQ